MKLSELIGKLQHDLETKGDTGSVALCLVTEHTTVQRTGLTGKYRMYAFDDIDLVHDSTGLQPNGSIGITYLVGELVHGQMREMADLLQQKKFLEQVIQDAERHRLLADLDVSRPAH